MTIMLSLTSPSVWSLYLLSHAQFGCIHKSNPTANENTKLRDQFPLLGLHTIEQRSTQVRIYGLKVQVLKFRVEDFKFT